MSSFIASDDSQSNSKENKTDITTPKKKASPLTSESVDRQNTSFNPYGRFKIVIDGHQGLIENTVKNVIKSFNAETSQSPAHFLKRRPEATQLITELKKLSGTIRTMAKTNSAAVSCTLSLLVSTFVELCETFDMNLNNVRSGDIMLMSQNLADVINIFAQFSPEPYTSDLLGEWNSLFETLLSSKVTILRKSGVNLWKSTFGKVKGSLKYPDGKLRKLLVSLQVKNKLTIPDAESTSPAKSMVYSDDEDEVAMDGIEVASEKIGPTGFAVPTVKDTGFQDSSTFELSQQPEFDKLAHQLVVEKQEEEKVEKEVKKRGRPTRKSKAMENALLDEDSRDFVVIKTPTSNRKAKLTERQKEMLQESGDGLNYVDEASQSASQRENALKTALVSMNFDVGNDSVSAFDVKHTSSVEVIEKPAIGEKKVEKVAEKEAEEAAETSHKPALKRTRRLFGSDLDLSSTEIPQKSMKMDAEIDALFDKFDACLSKKGVPRDDTLMVLPGMEAMRRNEESLNISEDKSVFAPILDDKEGDLLDYGELKEELNTSRNMLKKQLNPTRVVRNLPPAPTRSTRRRSAVAILFDEKDDDDKEKKEEEKKSDSVEKDRKKSVERTNEGEEMEVPHTPSARKVPKIATTPSILRKTPVSGTPLTERKRNRVHFDADSLSTIDRLEKKSVSPVKTHPIHTVEEESKKEDTVVLDNFPPMGGFDPESVIVYPSLRFCEDNVEAIVRKLVPLSGAVSAMSILKKSLSSAGIRTIGQFAGLTVQQVAKINGIRPVREKTAKKVLADYEAKKRLNTASVEKEIVVVKDQNTESSMDVEEVKKDEKESEVEKPVEVKENVEKENAKPSENQIIVATPSTLPEAMVESPEKIGATLEKFGYDNMEEEAARNKLNKKVEENGDSNSSDFVVESEICQDPSSFVTPKAVSDVVDEEVSFEKLAELEKSQNFTPFAAPKASSEVLEDALELDKISRRLARNVDRNNLSCGELEQVDDLLFDTLIRLRGLKELIRDRGLKK